MSKYVPPHLRNSSPQQQKSPPPIPRTLDNLAHLQVRNESAVTGKAPDEGEKQPPSDLDSKETLLLQEFFSKNSKIYNDWTVTRQEAHDNEHIAGFFEKKKAHSNRETRPGAHVGAKISKLFTQFYKYAIDIDNGLAYSQRCYDIAEAQGK